MKTEQNNPLEATRNLNQAHAALLHRLNELKVIARKASQPQANEANTSLGHWPNAA